MIARARTRVVLSVAVPLGLLMLGNWIQLPSTPRAWTGPVTLFGLVSPVIGYRLFAWLQETAKAGHGPDGCLRATTYALGVTELAALAGWASHLADGALAPLAGVAAHVLLAGALWPTEERFEAFARSDP